MTEEAMHSYNYAVNGLTNSQQMLSSCTGGMITALFMTPFDVIKVRLQAQQRELLNSRCFLYCNGLMDHICTCAPGVNSSSFRPWYSKPLPTKLNGTIDAFLKISRSEGFKTLWSGLPPTLIVAIPNTIVYLTCYEHLLKKIKQNYQEPPFWSGGLAGGLSRSWSVTIFSPLELLRTKMQSKNISYKEVFRSLANELKVQGIHSLWKGWTATVLRDVPFSVLYWMSYENLKQVSNQNHPTVTFSLIAGSIAGGIAGMVTLPLDVVKTHQQIEIGEKVLFPAGTRTESKNGARSTRSILMHIYSRQGVRGLFTGLVPRLAKVMPACAIMIATYEYAKNYFRHRNKMLLMSNLNR